MAVSTQERVPVSLNAFLAFYSFSTRLSPLLSIKIPMLIPEHDPMRLHPMYSYNPWDHGTRREPLSDEDTFAKLLKQTGGDGFNGDTMGFVPQSFWDAAEKVGYPIAFVSC